MLSETLYYKVLPLFLSFVEACEIKGYKREKQNLSKKAASGDAHLLLTHGRGGGVDKYVGEMAAKIEASGKQAWVLYFDPLQRKFLLSRGTIMAENALGFTFPSQYAALVTHLQSLGIGQFHIHHTRYLPLCVLRDLPEFASYFSISYDFMLHDFASFCPRIHLIDAHYQYCGMPEDVNACNTCVRKNGMLTLATKDMSAWRALGKKLLAGARERIAPSHDTAERHKKILGNMNIKVLPHDTPPVQNRKFPAKNPGDPYVVAVIGRIHRYKGANVLLACARDAKARKLPLVFKIIGDAAHADKLHAAGVPLTGVFRDNQLTELLTQSGASLVFLPSVWPETYSYVLSHIWQNGYFPVVFDIGAPAERIRAANNGLALPFALVNSSSSINDSLLATARKQHE